MDTHYLVGPGTDTCAVDGNGTMNWENKNKCKGTQYENS